MTNIELVAMALHAKLVVLFPDPERRLSTAAENELACAAIHAIQDGGDQPQVTFREFARERNGGAWPCITSGEYQDQSLHRMMETCADYMDALRGKR